MGEVSWAWVCGKNWVVTEMTDDEVSICNTYPRKKVPRTQNYDDHTLMIIATTNSHVDAT